MTFEEIIAANIIEQQPNYFWETFQSVCVDISMNGTSPIYANFAASLVTETYTNDKNQFHVS